MRFDREPWVKLYRNEGAQHRLMSLEARAFRDLLLRFADDRSGALIYQSQDVFRDLCRVVSADARDVRRVKSWVLELVSVGYLTLTDDGCLTIRRFVEGQESRSPNAARQAKHKEKKRRAEEVAAAAELENGHAGERYPGVTKALPVTRSVTSAEALQREEKRREGEEIPQTPNHVRRFEASFRPSDQDSTWPSDFRPSTANRELARGAGLDLEHEVSICGDYMRSKGRRSCDWQADLAIWMRREIKKRAAERADNGQPTGPVVSA